MHEPVRRAAPTCAVARTFAAAVVLVVAALAAAPAARAQAGGDAVNGKLLFDDTPNQTNNQQLNLCNNCHTVESRRARINPTQAPFGVITFATAQSRLQSAISSNVGGMGQFSVLSTTQVNDLAAYIADTPRTSATQLDFAPSAVNVSQSLPLDLTNAVAPSTQLGNTVRVASVAIAGANAADFSVTSDACSLQTLPAAGTCRVTVRFMSATTAGKTATLTFTLDPAGSLTNFTRDVALTGAVTVATPPPAPSPGGDDGGGGALGAGWLAALAAAVVAARRVTRRPR